MGMILAPVPKEQAGAWQAFAEALTSARKAEFDDFNKRYGLTKHEAWWCETPMGFLVVALHEGPGAEAMMPTLAQSTHEFDVWFRKNIEDIHGMDVSKPPPGPMPVRKIG